MIGSIERSQLVIIAAVSMGFIQKRQNTHIGVTAFTIYKIGVWIRFKRAHTVFSAGHTKFRLSAGIKIYPFISPRKPLPTKQSFHAQIFITVVPTNWSCRHKLSSTDVAVHCFLDKEGNFCSWQYATVFDIPAATTSAKFRADMISQLVRVRNVVERTGRHACRRYCMHVSGRGIALQRWYRTGGITSCKNWRGHIHEIRYWCPPGVTAYIPQRSLGVDQYPAVSDKRL